MSKNYKFNGKTFRYDFDHCVVEWISKADAEMVKEEMEWKANHNGRSLFDIDENGYTVVDSIGLRWENWDNRETRDEYLAEWIAELEYEAKLLARDFVG
jgi:hypothetical protein